MRLGKTGPFRLIRGGLLMTGCTTTAAPGTPEQRAAADARAILAEFTPPPGAFRLAKRPGLPGG